MPTRSAIVVSGAAKEVHRAGEIAAEKYVALAGGIHTAVDVRQMRADNEIVEAVAVHVTRRRYGDPGGIVGIDSGEPESIGAVQRREAQAGRESRRFAVNDIGFAAGSALGSTHDKVPKTVPVHVSRFCN